MSKKYTISEYAALKGISRQGVFYQIKKGKLQAEQSENGTWSICIDDENETHHENSPATPPQSIQEAESHEFSDVPVWKL